MYNTNDANKPAREQTVYTDHENVISKLFDNIDMLEVRLKSVIIANNIQNSDKTIPPAVLNTFKSQLKTWVSDQTSAIESAISRIDDLSNRLDID